MASTETKVIDQVSDQASDQVSEEKRVALDDVKNVQDDTKEVGTPPYDEGETQEKIIVTGADAANHLLSLRDDGETTLTFRSIFLASVLAAFQAVMSIIYYVSWLSFSLRLSTNLAVQTNLCLYPRNLYRHHCLLSRQGVGSVSSTW